MKHLLLIKYKISGNFVVLLHQIVIIEKVNSHIYWCNTKKAVMALCSFYILIKCSSYYRKFIL